MTGADGIQVRQSPSVWSAFRTKVCSRGDRLRHSPYSASTGRTPNERRKASARTRPSIRSRSARIAMMASPSASLQLPNRSRILLRCALAFVSFHFAPLFAQEPCPSSAFAATTFVSRWNERVSAAHLSSDWTIPKYSRLGFIRKNLDSGSLLVVAQVDKSGCIERIDVKSRRADGDGYAALVAWNSVIIVTNSSLSKEERAAIFMNLRLDKADAGGSFAINGVIYEFTETVELNRFSARPK